MSILKLAIVTTLTLSFSYAKLDFVKFGDICNPNLGKNCKNRSVEISAIQYLLKRKIDPNLDISGIMDNQTIKHIVNIQKSEDIKEDGYIGKETKDALNKLLYGHKLYNFAKVKKANSIKKSNPIVASVSKTDKSTILSTKVKPKKITISKSKETLANKPILNRSYTEFAKSINLRKSYAVYKDPKLLKSAKTKNFLLKIDISKQRVELVVNGKIALSAPCTTGSKHKLEPNTKTYRDKHTPTGSFKIMEKIVNKRSTIFGDIYRRGKRVYHGDRRKYRGSWRGVKFVGAPLKNWMRITSNGIGLHASSHVKRYPGSNGCIRIPPKIATTIFKKVKTGTKVKVVN